MPKADPVMNDALAARRAEELQKKLGFKTYTRFPTDLVEFLMDRPPKDEAMRAEWTPIHGPKTRVYSTYMRYSWCWPFCWEYALVADDRDEIMWEGKDYPKVLTEEAVADILGLSRQRVQTVVLDLVAKKRIRLEKTSCGPHGRQRALAVFLEAKPYLTKEDRRCKSTLAASGIEGPRLEPAVLRRFTNLFNQLGEDNVEISIAANGNGGINQVMRAGEYRHLAWQRVVDRRRAFIGGLKGLRSTERQGYAELFSEVRAVIQSSVNGKTPVNGSSAAGASAPTNGVHRPEETPPPPPPAEAPAAPTPAPSLAEQLRTFAEFLKEKFAGKGSQPTNGQCDQAFATLHAKKRSPEVFLQWLTPEKMRPIKSAGALMTLVKEFDGVCEDWERQRAAQKARAPMTNEEYYEALQNLKPPEEEPS